MDKKLLIAMLGVSHSLNHSLLLILPPLIPIITVSSHISVVTLGLIATLSSFAYGVGALAGGALSDRFGANRVLVASIGFSGASTIIIYLLPNEIGLGVGLFAVGVWASFYHPTAISLISKVYLSNRATALSIHGAVGSIGQVLAPYGVVALAVSLGWPAAFLAFGLVTFFLSLPFATVKSERVVAQRPFSRQLLESAQNTSLWAVFVYSMLMGLSFQAVTFIMPEYLVKARGLSVSEAGLAMSLTLAFGTVGQIMGGRFSDRIGGRTALVFSALGSLIGISLLLPALDVRLAVAVFVVLWGMFFYASQPASNALIASVTKSEVRGVMYGIYFTMGFGVGSFSAAVAGALSYSYGPWSAVLLGAVFSLCALAPTLFMPSLRRQAELEASERQLLAH